MKVPNYTLKGFLLSLLSTSSLVTAHSWVEQLMVLAPNGTMIGQPGFPRGNVLRTAPGFNDAEMVWLIPPDGGAINVIDPGQLMCRPEQTKPVQSSDSPRLQASPGQSVALRYQENGHVTLPQNQPGKPKGSGANFVYFTTKSAPDDKFLQIHRQWNSNGTGGDGKGRLISTQDFDDSQCYQINDGAISEHRQIEFKHETDTIQGAALWCQQDIRIPANAQPGTTVTLYWVWDWPTLPGTPGFPQGKQEIYTTCMDIDIVASAGQGKALAKGYIQQDYANAAASSQFNHIADPTAIRAQLIPFSGVDVINSSTATSTAQQQSSTASEPLVQTTATNIAVVPVTAPAVTPIPVSPVSNPAPLTVTVEDTVTVTVSQSSSPSGMSTRIGTDLHSDHSTLTPQAESTSTTSVTTVETDVVTVLVTSTVANQGSSKSAPGAPNTDPVLGALKAIDMLMSSVVVSVVVDALPSSVASSSCSTTAQAYRLRARNPFFILPFQDRPGANTSAGTACN